MDSIKEDGFSALWPLLLLGLIGLGLSGILTLDSHRKEMLKMTQMDRCVGKTLKEFKALLLQFQTSWDRVDLERKTALAACSTLVGCPPVLEALQAALQMERLVQIATQTEWLYLHSKWLSQQGHECKRTQWTPLKTLEIHHPYDTVDPSRLGLQSRWKVTQIHPLSLHLQNGIHSAYGYCGSRGKEPWRCAWGKPP